MWIRLDESWNSLQLLWVEISFFWIWSQIKCQVLKAILVIYMVYQIPLQFLFLPLLSKFRVALVWFLRTVEDISPFEVADAGKCEFILEHEL